jgi:hypothetical protein
VPDSVKEQGGDMPRLTPEERLAKAQSDRDRAIAELRVAAGQISARNRKADTRRKIILGGIVMRLMAANEGTNRVMQANIKRLPDRDRALFDGWTPPPLPKKKDPPKKQSQAPATAPLGGKGE